MNLLIILLLCLLAAIKVLTQSRFAKHNTKSITDSAMFIGTVFATMSILSFICSPDREVSGALLIGAACFGFFNVSFQIIYQIALSCGPTSITALIASLSTIVPLAVSAIVYDEPLTAFNFIGVVLVIATLVLNADIKKDMGAKREVGRKWFFLVILAFLANSLGVLSQQIYAKATGSASSFTFIACSSGIASIIAFAVCGVLSLKGKRLSYSITPKKVLPSVVVGTVLAVFQIIYTNAMSSIPGTVLFPTYSGGSTIFIALGSRLLFGERLSKAQRASLIVGIVAIVFINV